MFNPNTGFRIRKESAEVNKLLQDGWVAKNHVLIPPDNIKANYVLHNHYVLNTKWHTKNKTKVINPDTGKLVAYRTASGKKEFDVEYYDNDKIRLIPKDKSNYEKTIAQNWLKKETKAFKKAEEENLFQVKKVYLPNMDQDGNPVMVVIDSLQFAQMINDGFTYDEKKNLLRYPKYETVVEVKFPVSTADVETLMGENPRNITLVTGDERTNIPINTLRKTTEYINQVFFYKHHDGELRGTSGGHHVKFGIAFYGLKNCVISALEEHCNKHKYDLTTKFYNLYKKYKYGVYGHDYNDIARSLQLQIKVHVSNNTPIIFGKKTYKRALFVCNYDNNHVSKWNPEEKTLETKDKPSKWVTLSYDPKTLNQIQNIHGSLNSPTL